MRMIFVLAALAASPASALSLLEASQMVGMMKACGLPIDTDAAFSFITSRVEPNQPAESTMIGSSINLGADRVAEMDALSQRVTCNAMATHAEALNLMAKP